MAANKPTIFDDASETLRNFLEATQETAGLKDMVFESWAGSGMRNVNGKFEGTFTISFTGTPIAIAEPNQSNTKTPKKNMRKVKFDIGNHPSGKKVGQSKIK